MCFHLHRQACQLQWLSDFVGKHWWKINGKQNTPQRWNNMKQKNTIKKNSKSPKHHNQVVWSEDSEHLSILLNFKVLNLVEYLCTHRWAKTCKNELPNQCLQCGHYDFGEAVEASQFLRIHQTRGKAFCPPTLPRIIRWMIVFWVSGISILQLSSTSTW